MLKDSLKSIASAPLATALGVLSIALTATIVLGIGHGGKLSILQALGLGGAAVLAVLAATQASRSDAARQTARPTSSTAARRRAAASKPKL